MGRPKADDPKGTSLTLRVERDIVDQLRSVIDELKQPGAEPYSLGQAARVMLKRALEARAEQCADEGRAHKKPIKGKSKAPAKRAK